VQWRRQSRAAWFSSLLVALAASVSASALASCGQEPTLLPLQAPAEQPGADTPSATADQRPPSSASSSRAAAQAASGATTAVTSPPSGADRTTPSDAATTAEADAAEADTAETDAAAADAAAPLVAAGPVAAAQRLLLARGYPVGDIDGMVGPTTSAALRAFQTDRGLEPTGTLDAGTLAVLQDPSAAVVAQLPASVVVDLSDQQLFVHNAAGGLVSQWPVSTGGPGNETPTGSFAVQARQRVGTAKDAETVHMDWFTVFNGNVGFHGIPWAGGRDQRLWTPLGEYGVSHGCIRMDDANAQYLFDFLPDGAPVTVQP
jgi:lipoprotein-anchoring transpeptidase ErfK/SrfK